MLQFPPAGENTRPTQLTNFGEKHGESNREMPQIPLGHFSIIFTNEGVSHVHSASEYSSTLKLSVCWINGHSFLFTVDIIFDLKFVLDYLNIHILVMYKFCIYICIYMYVYVYVCMYVCIYVYMYVYVYVYVCVYYVCVCICVCVYMCIYSKPNV